MMTNAYRDTQKDSNKKIDIPVVDRFKDKFNKDRIKTISNKDKEIQTQILRHIQIQTQ